MLDFLWSVGFLGTSSKISKTSSSDATGVALGGSSREPPSDKEKIRKY